MTGGGRVYSLVVVQGRTVFFSFFVDFTVTLLHRILSPETVFLKHTGQTFTLETMRVLDGSDFDQLPSRHIFFPTVVNSVH